MTERRILHPQWRKSHDTTNYPFADNALLRNDSGDFIPETVFLDAILHPIGGLERMRLSQVIITHDSVEIFIGDGNSAELASGTFDILSPPDEVRLLDAFGRPAGLLVSESDRLAIFQSWSVGTHTFTEDETEFVARVCIPTPEIGFRGFILEDGSVFTGDIWIVADDGIVLTPEEITAPKAGCLGQDETRQVMRVDVVGDPLFRRRICGGLFTTPQFLREIVVKHGLKEIVCGPDSQGDFKISVGSQDSEDTVLRIRSIPEGLVIEAVGERVEGR